MIVPTHNNSDTVLIIDEKMSSLEVIHDEIDSGTWLGYLVEGWSEVKRRHSPCAMIGIKVAAAVGGVIAGGFIAASLMFAGLAFSGGVEVWKAGDIPFVIGHWSEWTMQAFFTTMVSLQVPSAISQLGRYAKVNQIFNRFLNHSDISQDEKELIYKEKLEYEAIQRSNLLFYNPSLPDTKGLVFSGRRIDENREQQGVYEEIEEALQASRFKNVKGGFHELNSHKKKSSMIGLKVLLAGGALFFTLDYVMYLMGIVFSGKQAVEDLHNGINPNVGGHTLEWTAEMFAVASFIYEVFAEIANVGKVRLITTLFNEKIQNNPDHKKRLTSEMKRQFRMVPEGYFFRLPTYLLFKSPDL